jgi:hypothetical protein
MLKYKEKDIEFIREHAIDTFAAQQIQPLLNDSTYLPFSTASLRYASIATFLNDIVVNRRETIVEFGSGITTYLIAKLFKRNGLHGRKLFTVDDNITWLNIVKELLAKDGLHENVVFIHAPLCENEFSIQNTKWYDLTILSEYLQQSRVDSVLVDGPEAWYKEVKFSRYPALPFINSFLKDNCAVFLDDINREGEQKIIELWKSEFGFTYQKFNNSFGGMFRGDNFNTRLFESFA